MPAFEAEVGMPYWLSLTTTDPAKSRDFYSAVLGWEFEERMARLQGLPIAELIPADRNTWATYFLSRDLESDSARAEQLGGRVLSPPQPVDRGRMTLLVDASGGMFGLIEPALDQFIAGGEPGTPVWHELAVTSGFTSVLDFYGELFNWDMRGDDSYALAEEEGAAFAGFWNAQGQFPPEVPSFWQTYLGVRDVAEAARLAVEHGGEVIRPPHESPFGVLCIIADSTGATVTLCEVEDAPDEPVEL